MSSSMLTATVSRCWPQLAHGATCRYRHTSTLLTKSAARPLERHGIHARDRRSFAEATRARAEHRQGRDVMRTDNPPAWPLQPQVPARSESGGSIRGDEARLQAIRFSGCASHDSRNGAESGQAASRRRREERRRASPALFGSDTTGGSGAPRRCRHVSCLLSSRARVCPGGPRCSGRLERVEPQVRAPLVGPRTTGKASERPPLRTGAGRRSSRTHS